MIAPMFISAPSCNSSNSRNVSSSALSTSAMERAYGTQPVLRIGTSNRSESVLNTDPRART
jgi:hypothetical protein